MQKALFISYKKGPWQLGGRPIPKPGKGEVLVKIHAIALNPVDWKIQKEGLFIENYPAVIGSDSSGEVEEIGEGVTNFKEGDRVVHQAWSRENDKAAFQQFTICPAEILSPIPASLSFNEASTLPLGLATAIIGFFNPIPERGIALTPFWAPDGKTKYANKPIVILGGSSSVGQFAIQVARLSGFNPIITTSSLKHTSFLRSIGASHVVDRHLSTSALVSKIREHLPDRVTHVEVAYDAISTYDTQVVAVKVTTPKASIALTNTPSDKLDWGERTAIFTFGNVHAQRKIGVELYRELYGLLKSGEIKPNRVEFLKGGLGAIPDGLARMERNEVSGVKLVANPWE